MESCTRHPSFQNHRLRSSESASELRLKREPCHLAAPDSHPSRQPILETSERNLRQPCDGRAGTSGQDGLDLTVAKNRLGEYEVPCPPVWLSDNEDGDDERVSGVDNSHSVYSTQMCHVCSIATRVGQFCHVCHHPLCPSCTCSVPDFPMEWTNAPGSTDPMDEAIGRQPSGSPSREDKAAPLIATGHIEKDSGFGMKQVMGDIFGFKHTPQQSSIIDNPFILADRSAHGPRDKSLRGLDEARSGSTLRNSLSACIPRRSDPMLMAPMLQEYASPGCSAVYDRLRRIRHSPSCQECPENPGASAHPKMQCKISPTCPTLAQEGYIASLSLRGQASFGEKHVKDAVVVATFDCPKSEPLGRISGPHARRASKTEVSPNDTAGRSDGDNSIKQALSRACSIEAPDGRSFQPYQPESIEERMRKADTKSSPQLEEGVVRTAVSNKQNSGPDSSPPATEGGQHISPSKGMVRGPPQSSSSGPKTQTAKQADGAWLRQLPARSVKSRHPSRTGAYALPTAPQHHDRQRKTAERREADPCWPSSPFSAKSPASHRPASTDRVRQPVSPPPATWASPSPVSRASRPPYSTDPEPVHLYRPQPIVPPNHACD
jgi:hypothetical protein